MSSPTADEIKQAIVDAGLEVYRTDGSHITVAERVRLHLMDSGVTVDAEPEPAVSVTVRCQRSDSPSASPEQLFARVREAMADATRQRGFAEVTANTREVTDPVDDTNVLDVWHELTYSKPCVSVDEVIEDVRWALALPKCVDG